MRHHVDYKKKKKNISMVNLPFTSSVIHSEHPVYLHCIIYKSLIFFTWLNKSICILCFRLFRISFSYYVSTIDILRIEHFKYYAHFAQISLKFRKICSDTRVFKKEGNDTYQMDVLRLSAFSGAILKITI